jgi:hypothetical protein
MAGFTELADTVRRLEQQAKALEGQIAELKARPQPKSALPEVKSRGTPANPHWNFAPLDTQGPLPETGGGGGNVYDAVDGLLLTDMTFSVLLDGGAGHLAGQSGLEVDADGLNLSKPAPVTPLNLTSRMPRESSPILCATARSGGICKRRPSTTRGG